jgi:hypothetical protein
VPLKSLRGRGAVAFAPLLVAVAWTLLGFVQFLFAGFASSDWWPVVATNHLASLADVPRLFQEPIGNADAEFIQQTAHHYRPLATLSFAIDYHLWGLDVPVGWQITNLLVHVGVVVGVYVLARRLGLAPWASALAAILFTSHPAIVATEPAMARRHDTLSVLFLLPSLILLLDGRLLLSGIAFLCSVLSKEATLAAIPLLPALLYVCKRPLWWSFSPVVAALVAIGMRLLALGNFGGYGTVAAPGVDAVPAYREVLVRYFEALLSPGPDIPTFMDVGYVMVVVVVLVTLAAWLCRGLEGRLALFGLAWVVVFGEFYAYLKVFAGAWYLYPALIGPAIGLAAVASAGVRRMRQGSGKVLLGVAGAAAIWLLLSAPLITRYPEWSSVGREVSAYLSLVDRCAEGRDPPLIAPENGPKSRFIQATGLLPYSVRAYITLRFPNGRPCAPP